MTEKRYFYSVGRSEADPVQAATVKIKRSVFTCSLAYAGSIEAAKAFISKVARENKTATHNCWAYVVGEKGEISHSSDAGEPAGTAGKPMLNALTSHGMTQVAAVVTRQYGGVKLGVRGLIEAYGESVAAAIGVRPLVKLVKTVSLRVVLDYGVNDTFLNQAGRFSPEILDTAYSERVCHEMVVEADEAVGFEGFLTEYQNQGLLEWERV